MATISVIIPTHNRPIVVLQAVASALDQTFRDIEVVVVIDGESPETVSALQGVGDSRLRWVSVAESVGGAEARNVGVRAANGEWIAFLDDDDEWLPEKLAEQMKVAVREGPDCFVACRYVDRKATSEIVLPLLPPATGQPISEYLFCEVSLLGFTGGFLQTSTWLVPRRAAMAVPFTKGLARNQDTDWLIRGIPSQGLRVFVVWQTLAIFHNEATVGRITTKSSGWRYTLDWALERRPFFTSRSFPYYLATNVIYKASAQGEPLKTFALIFGLARKNGQLTPSSVWQLFANWFIFPRGRFGVRSRIQNWLSLRKAE